MPLALKPGRRTSCRVTWLASMQHGPGPAGGTHTAPSFEDAVAVHRVIAAIERAAESGSRTVLA